MPKTYYLGKMKSGAYVARASKRDYGYTHAAVKLRSDFYKPDDRVVNLSAASFSRSRAGAIRNGVDGSVWVSEGVWRDLTLDDIELVELHVVDAATYKAATGKA